MAREISISYEYIRKHDDDGLFDTLIAILGPNEGISTGCGTCDIAFPCPDDATETRIRDAVRFAIAKRRLAKSRVSVTLYDM